MAVTFKVGKYAELKKQLQKTEKATETVIKRTLSDVRTRAPAWIAKEVAAQYGVKKSEVNSGKLGSVKVQGDRIETVEIVYTGRLLTPMHFGMTPKTPGKGAYTLKASIIKGQTTTLGKVKKLTKKQRAMLTKNLTGSGTQNSERSPIMLMAPKGTYIPFQRKSKNRKDVEVIKTVSLPQMVSSDRTAPNISKSLTENLQKRLDQHMKLLR